MFVNKVKIRGVDVTVTTLTKKRFKVEYFDRHNNFVSEIVEDYADDVIQYLFFKLDPIYNKLSRIIIDLVYIQKVDTKTIPKFYVYLNNYYRKKIKKALKSANWLDFYRAPNW